MCAWSMRCQEDTRRAPFTTIAQAFKWRSAVLQKRSHTVQAAAAGEEALWWYGSCHQHNSMILRDGPWLARDSTRSVHDHLPGVHMTERSAPEAFTALRTWPRQTRRRYGPQPPAHVWPFP